MVERGARRNLLRCKNPSTPCLDCAGGFEMAFQKSVLESWNTGWTVVICSWPTVTFSILSNLDSLKLCKGICSSRSF